MSENNFSYLLLLTFLKKFREILILWFTFSKLFHLILKIYYDALGEILDTF